MDRRDWQLTRPFVGASVGAMRILMVTLGSHGDIHPFIALARALRAAGHEAAILTNPYFERQITAGGVELLPIGDAVDLPSLIKSMPHAMDGVRGPMTVLRTLVLPGVPQLLSRIRECVTAWKPDAVVAHPIALGASWVCGQAGVPCILAHLSPISWFNPRDTIVMTPFRSERPSPRAVAFDVWIGGVMTSVALDGPLNRIRRELGLPRARRIWYNESRGGDLNLGLWSPQFRGPLEGDPATGAICGFPWFDRRGEHDRERVALERFLESGPAPIVFTLGTAVVHVARRFYEEAARAARMLGRRAVLLVGRGERGPSDLPPGMAAFEYAEFSHLLPRAAATVHHGGIGTTAQALRAGRPTVVVPASHDQFDNAARVSRLGISRTVKFRRARADHLAAALRVVLEDPGFGERAALFSVRMGAEDGAAAAATRITSMLGSRAFSPR